jgi:hypothetical protein
MKRQFILYVAFLLVLCVMFSVSSAQAQKGKSKVSDSQVAATAKSTGGTGQCKAPRPPNRGCKVACKPCQVPVCEDGKWQYEKIELDPAQCRPHPNDDGGACTIGATDFCPPSCKRCIRQ